MLCFWRIARRRLALQDPTGDAAAPFTSLPSILALIERPQRGPAPRSLVCRSSLKSARLCRSIEAAQGIAGVWVTPRGGHEGAVPDAGSKERGGNLEQYPAFAEGEIVDEVSAPRRSAAEGFAKSVAQYAPVVARNNNDVVGVRLELELSSISPLRSKSFQEAALFSIAPRAATRLFVHAV